MVDYSGIPNLLQPESSTAAAGQPTATQLTDAVNTGLRRVINLRPTSEDAGYDEAAVAQALGIEYHCIPVAGAQDLNESTVRQFDALLSSEHSVPTLVHCASGNRVGALAALRAAWVNGVPADLAMEIGRRWGLTKLEAVVRRIMSQT